MVRNIIIYIFIYILSIGCDSHCYINCPDIDSFDENEECFFESYLELDASNLEMDENGYYHLNWLEGYVQTFTTLNAGVGLQYQMIHWESDKEYNIPWTNGDNWTDLVNNTSYTGMDGIGHTVLGVREEFVGDTITITCNYNYCDSSYVNLMRVIVE